MRQENRLIAPNSTSLAAALATLGKRPLYVTFDLNIFDPSQLPGTGTPEAGGIDWQTCKTLLQALSGENIVALDIMELAPTLDPSEISSVLAAKLLREWILLLS